MKRREAGKGHMLQDPRANEDLDLYLESNSENTSAKFKQTKYQVYIFESLFWLLWKVLWRGRGNLPTGLLEVDVGVQLESFCSGHLLKLMVPWSGSQDR